LATVLTLFRPVLRRAGLGELRFRGWRCQTPYPVPLVEIQLGFRIAGRRDEVTPAR
jgi:hypothetical protein